MDSHPTSDAADSASVLRFLDVNGQPIAAPGEWAPARVEVLVPATSWEQVALFCQGGPLPLLLAHLDGRARIVAEWPRSGPGHYRLRLTRANEATYERSVTIAPHKISPAAFSQLILDLESQLPAAIAIGLQRLGALSGITLQPPAESTLAAELVRLRRAVEGDRGRPGLIGILEHVARDPHQVLASHDEWVRRDLARRPHPARLPQVVARPHNLDSEQRPRYVLDTRVEHTVDVYENQLVKAYTYEVLLRLRRLVRMLQAKMATGREVDAQRMLDRLALARRLASFLNAVSLPAQLPNRITMVLVKRPAYRAALESYLAFHRSAAVRLEEPALDAPLENLPHLYQLWGTLQVVQALVQVAAELGYVVRTQRLVMRDASGTFIQLMPGGVPILVLTHPQSRQVVKLISERTYPSTGALHSISYDQRPDVAIEIERPDARTCIYLFDPKYKLDGEIIEGETAGGQPKKIDIDKMHAYRDAIRDADHQRIVAYASTLYPGPEVRYAPGIEALHAYPGAAELLETRLIEVLTAALAPV
jgi:hypothetical protein